MAAGGLGDGAKNLSGRAEACGWRPERLKSKRAKLRKGEMVKLRGFYRENG